MPGRVKTRLQPALSPEQACEVHTELVRHTAQVLVASGLGRVQLVVAGDTAHPLFRQCLASGVAQVTAQTGGDLGQRMFNALGDGLLGFQRVVLVGSDCPQLDRDYLEAALTALEACDVVLGPARDGGYVLIAARRVDRYWFADIDWGTGAVYAQTVQRLTDSGAHWRALPSLSDVDRPEDLPLWRAVREDG